MIRILLAVVACVSLVPFAAQAQTVTFDLTGVGDLNTTDPVTLTDPATGLELTISNPSGAPFFNQLCFGASGWDIGGFCSPDADLTFSDNVRLSSYEVAFPAAASFSLVQGTKESLDQSANVFGSTFFRNTTSTFAGGQPIAFTSVNSFSLRSITVQIEEPISFIGDTYTANLYTFLGLASSQESVAALGPDTPGSWQDALAYDVEASTITVRSLLGPGDRWTIGIAAEFLSLDYARPGVEIVSAQVLEAVGQGWDRIDSSDLTVTADSVRINMGEIANIQASLDQFVRIKLVDSGCRADIADSSGFGPPDGVVDFGDFFALSFLVGPCGGGTSNPDCVGDISLFGGSPPNNVIDFADFFTMSFFAGPCP